MRCVAMETKLELRALSLARESGRFCDSLKREILCNIDAFVKRKIGIQDKMA